jgi:hypothetical protein
MTITIKPTLKQHEAYEALKNDALRCVFFGGSAGGGKILADEGVICTPFGWKKGKDLKVGDLVNHPNGSVQRIIQVHPRTSLPLWRVHFSDGTHTDVAKSHLWQAWRGQRGRKIENVRTFGVQSREVVETQELQEWLQRGYKPQIPVCEPVRFNTTTRSKSSIIDPYILGLLLGDGCITTCVQLACSEEDKLHYVSAIGLEDLSLRDCEIDFKGAKKRAIKTALIRFGLYGKKSYSKFIPKIYKTLPVEQRYALVQGLMDTDGYSPRNKSGCYYTTVSPQLAEDMAYLLRSLGAVVTISKGPSSYRKNGELIKCLDSYDLYIKHPNKDLLFSLPRKKEGRTPIEISKAVVRVEETDEVITGRCITVSNPDGLYITNDFIVTHNSWLLAEWQMLQRIRFPNTKGFIGRNELKRLMQTSYLTLLKVHAHHGITDKMWRLDGKYNFIEYYNGSRIDLLDLAYQPSDPMYERLGSLEYTDGSIDEAGEVDFMAFDILKSRLGRQKNEEYGIKPKLLLTCNPNKKWIYQQAYKPWRAGMLQSDWAFISSGYQDNPYTAKIYAEQLASIKDNAMRERLMYGNWEYEDDATQLMSTIAIGDIYTNTLDDDGKPYITADVARYGSDLITIYVWKGLEAINVTYHAKKSTLETARLIRDKEITYGVPRSQTLVDEDGVGGGVVDSLPGCRGFMGGSSPLPDKDGVYPAFQNLKAQCAYKLSELVQGHKLAVRTEDMFIKERLSEELQQIRRRNEDKDGKLAIVAKDEVKKALGRSPDFADAVLMRAFFELNKEPPKIVEKKPMYQKELEQFQRDRRQTIGKKF